MTTPQARWVRGTEVVILAVGIGLRLARLLQARPLWLDESLLTLNILGTSPAGLLRPLDDAQISPLGFMWLEWLVTRLAGTGEHALRFIPFVASIVALVAFARLSRRILEPGAALLATTFAALSPLLIYYSAEVKSYGLDWLGAVLLMHATLTLIDDNSRDAWIRWSLTAAISALLSTPAPFFIAGCGFALLLAPEVWDRSRGLLRLAAAATPAVLIFGLHLLTVYDSSATTSFMQEYWTATFIEPRVPSGLLQAARIAREYWVAVLFGTASADALPAKSMTIILALSALGALALGRRSLPTAVFLLGPLLFAGVASMAKYWPMTGRLMLFAVPAVIVTLSAGVALVARLAPAKVRAPLHALLALALIAVALRGVPRTMQVDPRFIDVPSVLREAHDAGPAAVVYLSADMVKTCTYYLAWHPDGADLGGVPASRECAFRDGQVVVGEWPILQAQGLQTDVTREIEAAWLEREGRRILEKRANEIRLFIGLPHLRTVLPSWLEASGAIRVSDRETKHLRIVGYRLP